ncbi:MAG TPA: hypothetical protein VGF77_09745 [Allosphingosinicella sp.]
MAEETIYQDGTRASKEADADTSEGQPILTKEAGHHGGILFHKDQVVRSLVNDADPSGEDFYKFQNFVLCYHLHAARMKTPDTDLVSLGSVNNLTDITNLDGKTFDVRKSSSGAVILVRKGGEEDRLELVKYGDTDVPAPDSSADLCSSTDLNTANFSKEVRQLDARKVHFDFVGGPVASSTCTRDRTSICFAGRGSYFLREQGHERISVPVAVAATIRSTEALIYFLGEYTRYPPSGRFQAPPGAQEVGSQCVGTKPYDLMVLNERHPIKSVLSATLHGKTWWVPANSVECNGRTMDVIALVEQLYNLHKSSADKVGTQSVRLIQ